MEGFWAFLAGVCVGMIGLFGLLLILGSSTDPDEW